MAKWTPKEDAQICDLRSHGAELDEIAGRFPHRTRGAVAKRVQHLIFRGTVERRGRPRSNERWSSSDDAAIVRLRARGATFSEIASHFPSRTSDAVTARIRHLVEDGKVRKRRDVGTRKKWSTAEDTILKKMRRKDKTMDEMAAAVQRTVAAVNGRIATMIRTGELTLRRNHRPWTVAEDQRIIHLQRAGKTTAEIAAVLNRTTISVERHIEAKLSDVPRTTAKPRRRATA